MTAEAPPGAPTLVGDDLARALVRRGGQTAGRRRGGFREGAHERPTCGPSYVHRTTRIPLPADRDVSFRGHVRGAVEMMVELGVLDSTDEVVILAMLTLANESGLLAWANQRKIGRRSHVGPNSAEGPAEAAGFGAGRLVPRVPQRTPVSEQVRVLPA